MIVQCIQGWQQVVELKNKPDLRRYCVNSASLARSLEEDLVARWVVNAAEQVEQGGFSSTARLEYDNEVAD